MSKRGTLLIGGAYFSDTRLKFFDNKLHDVNKHRFNIIQTDWRDVEKGKKIDIPDSDFIFLFGLKKWTRRLHKKRYKPKRVVGIIRNFLKKNVPGNIPFGVLDDLNFCDEKPMGDGLRKILFNEFNCKVILLREYWADKKYDKRVYPFSICCVDNTHMLKSAKDKKNDICFRGNDSSSDRKPLLDKIKKWGGIKKDLSLYRGGEKSGEKVTHKEYLTELSNSNFCLHFKGAGYCCFRYQEIPSVGSIIVSPNYPFIVRNDYEDMKSCIRYDSIKEMKKKVMKVMDSDDYLKEMQASSVDIFLKNHTTEARYNWFLEAIEKL